MSLRGSYSRRGRGPALTSFPGRLVVGWRASGDAAVPLSAWSPAPGKLGARSRVDSADVGRQTHLIRGGLPDSAGAARMDALIAIARCHGNLHARTLEGAWPGPCISSRR